MMGETSYKIYASTEYVESRLINHQQSANTIGEGIFSGAVAAKAEAQTPGAALLRNSKLVMEETTPTNNGEIFWVYE